MKVRNLAVLATVAVGATALAAPTAFAADAKASKSKALTRTDNDIKRLGNNVNDLRKADDETNARITRIVEGLGPVLNQLGDAAESYANFQYGFAQLTFGGVPVKTFYTTTPRLDPTQQQSTVEKTFWVPPLAALTGKTLGVNVGVRSLNDPAEVDNESTAYCNVTLNKEARAPDPAATITNAGNGAFAGSKAEGLPFYPIQRSSLKPNDSADELMSLVGQVPGDRVDNLIVASKIYPASQGGTQSISTTAAGAGGGSDPGALNTLTVTLSCLALDNAALKDNGVTPPFAKK